MALSTEDRLEIQELYARYNHALDFGDAPGWAGCFTPDGVFSSANGTFTGSEQLQQFANGYTERVNGRHWTNNLVIDPAGEGAAGKCYLVLYRIAEGGPSILTSGVYNDELVRTAAGWRFSKRTVTGDS